MNMQKMEVDGTHILSDSLSLDRLTRTGRNKVASKNRRCQCQYFIDATRYAQ